VSLLAIAFFQSHQQWMCRLHCQLQRRYQRHAALWRHSLRLHVDQQQGAVGQWVICWLGGPHREQARFLQGYVGVRRLFLLHASL